MVTNSSKGADIYNKIPSHHLSSISKVIVTNPLNHNNKTRSSTLISHDQLQELIITDSRNI